MKKLNIILLFILLYNLNLAGQHSVCDTLIDYIVSDNNEKALSIISKPEFNPDCLSEFGGSPLGTAARRGNNKLVKALLKKGASPNHPQKGKYFHGETPLFEASTIYEQALDPILEINSKKRTFNYKIKDQIVKILLKSGADVNITDNKNNTALMFACQTGRTTIVKLFLQKNVDIDAQNTYGNTSLIYSVLGNYPEIVKILIKAGVDKDIKNNKGETALDIAKMNNNLSLVQLLQDSIK